MIRPLAALAVAGALVAPHSADAAVIRCQTVGQTYSPILVVCAGAGLNGDGDTVNPTVYWGCRIGQNLMCTGEPIEVGRTGVDEYGIWIAGGRLT
jgi:hypothetical protein